VVGAAAAVVMVVGLVVTIQAGRGRPVGQPVGAAPVPSTSDSSAPQPAPTPTGPLPDLAATPVQLPPGAVLLIRRTYPGYWHEIWVDPEGMVVLRIESSGLVGYQPGTDPGQIAADRAAFAQQGPSLDRPSPAYVATLPTDPSGLLALLTELGRSGSGQHRDDLIFKEGISLMATIEPLLSAEQRAALLAAFALAPGATVDHSPRRYAGHDVYLVEQTTSVGVSGFIVDSGTGRLVGDYAGVGGLTDTNSEQLSYAVVGAAGERP
jgi:hypothetical protein